ncbi:MAG: hypothetical protein ACRCZB_01920 [Bacteroidales bacterium]
MFLNHSLQQILESSLLRLRVINLNIELAEQLDFLEQTQHIRKPLTENYFTRRWEDLRGENTPLETKKKLLVEFSSMESVKVMRALEEFAANCPQELSGFAQMAVYQNKLLLEASILEEHQVLLASGLGGENDKLRLFIVLVARSHTRFSSIQQEIIRKELDYNLTECNIKLEKISFEAAYAKSFCLVPLNIDLRACIESCIVSCNELGNFIDERIIATSEREFTTEELDKMTHKEL